MGNEHKNKNGSTSSSSVPALKSATSTTSTSAKVLDEHELLRLPPVELVGRLKKAENDKLKVINERSEMVKDINQRVQMYMNEIRNLKERNQRLQDDNQELRDLCCFLDDDRQKGRKLAREWQRFGRYTASVMRQEVANYQEKLHELDTRQQELVKENLELKDLCLYLDEERISVHKTSVFVCSHCGMPNSEGQRDEGDGSSSSTNNEEGNYALQTRTNSNEGLLDEHLPLHRNAINEQVLQYIRSLERKIHQLEDHSQPVVPPQKPPRLVTDGGKLMLKPLQPPPYRKPPCPPKLVRPTSDRNNVSSGCKQPEAVMHAMKVLEVYEKLEKEERYEQDLELAEGEKALVKEMCNVVWRKLEEGPETS